MTASALFVSLLLHPAAAQDSVYADVASSQHIDELMELGDQSDWAPQTFEDLRYPWPERYVEQFHQPFAPWTFAINASALAESVRLHGSNETIENQIKYLDFVARLYTRSDGSCTYVVNDFDYPDYWTTMQKGFKGAFMNAVTAYGYMLLYEANDDPAMLKAARELLFSAAICESPEVRLHSVDDEGQYWLNEYVFNLPVEDYALFRSLGFHQDASGTFRSRIYNGHMHALLAYVKFAVLTKSDEFDRIIAASIKTMARYLPRQLNPSGYFSYQVEIPEMPDYSQERAVLLPAALCDVSRDKDLCQTATDMRAVYDEQVKDKESELYDAGVAAARKRIDDFRAAQAQN